MSENKDKLYTMRYSYHGLSDLVSHIGSYYDLKNFSMIEIGSYAGESTTYFAKFFKDVIAIDPFINDYDTKDPTCSFMALNNVYESFLKNISPYKNIYHIKDISDNAILYMPTYLIDKAPVLMIYIDGLHTFNQVTTDIKNYYPLIVKNGFLCGHDYHEKAWPGVYKAINDFQTPDKTFSDSSWLIQKK